MQKKHMGLLVAIFALTFITSMIGATFAYFSASVKTTNDANKTINVTAQTLVTATMDLGSTIDGANKLPGFKALKTLTLTGEGVETATPINTRLTLTPSVTDFGSHIKYSIYKVATSDIGTKAVTCAEGTLNKENNHYSQEYTCDASKAGTAVATGTFSGTTAVTYDIEVSYNTADTYYVVVEYVNDVNSQNDEIGKSFSVTLSYDVY